MLQQLEAFNGVAVLTTNRSEALDPALSRRMDAWIHIPLPAMEERMALWMVALDTHPPLSGVDLMLLAAIPISGGEIVACVRELSLTGGPLSTPALLAAARRRSERSAMMGG
jgi:SpoVK/Ycf46/Vps4 family AAA+-type ATPase